MRKFNPSLVLSLLFPALLLSQDTLIESFRSFPITLNPLLATDEVSISIADKIFNGLFTLDKDGKVVPDLIKRWRLQGNSIVFELKENVYWHDGKKISTDDVIFTWKLMKDHSFQYPYRADIDFIKEIVPLDSMRAKIIMAKKVAPFLLYMTFKILPAHEKEKCRRSDIMLPGTGPYKFHEIKINQHLLLKKFEKYFNGEPKIPFYKLTVNTDPILNPIKLLKDEIHLGELEHDVYRTMVKNQEFNSKVNVIQFMKNSYTYLAFNMRNHVLSKKMRKAISYSIPRKQMVESLLSGMGEVANSHIIFKPWRINGLDYKFNPEISKKIISKLGWKSGRNGFFEKDGRPLKFLLITNGESILRRYCVSIIKDALEKTGIKIEIKLYEYLSFRSALKKGDFDLAISGYLMDLDPNVWDLFSTKGVLNYANFSNPYLDALMIKGKETLEPERRKDIYLEIQKILWDELPVLPLFTPYYLMGASKNLEISEKPEIVGSTNSFSSFLCKWRFKKIS